MIDEVVTRLEVMGYTVTENDKIILKYVVQSCTDHILNATNLDEIPDGLHSQAVDMVCGLFIKEKKTTSPADLTGFDLGKAVKSISEGDTSVTYDGTKTDEERLDDLISDLIQACERDLVRYRVLTW